MIDIEELLAPVSEDQPTGVDLRTVPDDLTFSEVPELRREVDASVDPEGAKEANWSAVSSTCEAALRERTKDLQIAGWLAEALARTEGFSGLRQGLQLVHRLLETYWDELHPAPEREGEGEDETVLYDVRVGALNWLAAPRGLVPTLRGVGIVGEGFDRRELLPWNSYLEAQRVDEAAVSSEARHKEMLESGAVTMKRWKGAAKVSDVDRLREDRDAIVECKSTLGEITELCESRLPEDDQPSFLELTDLLSEIGDWLDKRVPDEPIVSDDDDFGSELEASGEGGAASSVGSTRPAGPVASRAAAFAQLRDVARFFRENEPHSPVSLLIDRAVRWGDLSFTQVLLDVVKSEDTLEPFWDTLGIKPEDAASGSSSDDDDDDDDDFGSSSSDDDDDDSSSWDDDDD
jgi:type VI secretion system protein ImpA